MGQAPRRHTPTTIELRVLYRSRRRCALCVYIDQDFSEKHGQIAHLDQDPANFAEDNLAFLCLPHHSVYDSKTSQHKNYTLAEVKRARDNLYVVMQNGNQLLSIQPVRTAREIDIETLADITNVLGKETIPFLRRVNFHYMSYPVHKTDPIEVIAEHRESAEHEFLDGTLEDYRKWLLIALLELGHLLERFTRPLPKDLQTRHVPSEWKKTRPTYQEDILKLHEAARATCAAYDNLVRAGRHRLLP